jgi:hypothetical protein
MRGFLRLCTLAALLEATAAQGDNLADTTLGTQENNARYGGISEQEQNALDEKTKKFLEGFKQGRAAKDGGRHWEILTLHDRDKDGIADHGLNGLEANMDAAGKIKTKDEADPKRREEVDEQRKNAGRCKNGTIGGNADNDCRNVSSVIVDLGAAHGDEKDAHRVYDLTREARDEAKKAADAYARRVTAEAANYEVDDEAKKLGYRDGGVGTDSKGRYGKILVDKDGKRMAVAPNIDYLHSEAAFLNQQAVNTVETEAKTLRAMRLAGVDTSKGGTDDDIARLIQNSKPGEVDDKLAERIAQRNIVGSESAGCSGSPSDPKYPSYCKNIENNASFKSDFEAYKNDNCSRANVSATECVNNWKAGLTVNKIASRDSKVGSLAYKKAYEELGDEKKKQIKTDVSSVKECMKPGVWCRGGLNDRVDVVDGKASAAFRKIKGEDAAAVFTDTREAIFSQAAMAINGPADQMMNRMKQFEADFNKNNDAKTRGNSGIEYYKEWEELQKRAIQRAKQQGLDPSKMSTAEIFKQDRQRGDGGTLRRPGSDQAPVRAQPPGPSTGRGRPGPPPSGNLMNPGFLVPGASY